MESTEQYYLAQLIMLYRGEANVRVFEWNRQ